MKEGWEYKKLGEICKVFCDGDWIESKDQSDNGIRLIQTGNVGNGEYKDKAEKSKYISEETFKRLNCTEIFPGDVLVSRLPDPIGRACVIPDIKARMITAVDCSIIRFKDIKYSKLFVYYTQSGEYARNIEKYTTGATRKRISRSNLGLVCVPIPSIEDQLQIISELDLLSGIVEKQKAQLEELDKLAQSIFYDMFGDPVTNEKDWTIYKWKDVLLIYNGRNQSQVEDPNGIYPICGSGGVMGYANDYICPDNSIILGRKGNINNPIYMTQKFWNVDTAFGLSPKKSLDSFYLYFFCKIFNFEQLNVAVTIPSLRKNDLLNIPIPLPPLSLQQEFAAKVEAIEAMKAKVRQSLKEAETLFNERMDYYFN